MQINQDNLIRSSVIPKLGMKCIDIGNGLFLPVSGNSQQIAFGQVVGYDENGQPIIQQLEFNGVNTNLSQTEFTSKLYDFNSDLLSLIVTNKFFDSYSSSSSSLSSYDDGFEGQYVIVDKTKNGHERIWVYNNYYIQYNNNRWQLTLNGNLLDYSIETQLQPTKSTWNGISVRINQSVKSQVYSLYKCYYIDNQHNTWVGRECEYNNENDSYIETNHINTIEILNVIPQVNSIYLVFNNKKILSLNV